MTDLHAWPENVTQGMVKEIHNHNTYEVFDERPVNLYECLNNTASLYPNKNAIIEEGRAVTFMEFKELVDSFSYSLYSQYNIRKGDRIALLMVNSIDFCISFYSLAKLGAIPVPLSTKSKSTELVLPLIDSDAKLLILNGQWWCNVKDIINQTNIKKYIFSGNYPEGMNGSRIEDLYLEKPKMLIHMEVPESHDPLTIMYTSGTTGKPKGALLTHSNVIHGIICYKRILNLTSEDSTVIGVPIFHITGLAALLGLFIYLGGTIYLQPFFNSKTVLQTVKQHNITFLHGSPTVFILLLNESQNFKNLKSLRKAACGSANMPAEVLNKIKKWLPEMDFHTVYGLTETSSPAAVFPGDVYKSVKLGSSGIPIPGVEMKIVDDHLNELAPGNIGELMVKGTVVLDSYWNNNEITNKAIVDGWFRTGDMAKINADGYLYIVDRKKDMINRGGEKVYSLEVENVLYSHPAIKEAAVIGIPDSIYGEVVEAFIVLNEGDILSEVEVKEWVKQRLAKFKVPQKVVFLDEMPRVDNGKISKNLIKSMYA
jgi:long-chain acyl-CoA synthetase